MTFHRNLLAVALALAAAGVLAQGAGSAAKPASAPAPVSAAKKELVQKVLQLQQPQYENVARALAEQSVAQLAQQASLVLQAKVAPDKREAVAKDVQGDLKKYMDEVVPLLRDRVTKVAPSTIGAVLEEKFSEDELKTLIGIIESPVQRKFLQLNGEMSQVLMQKLVAETRGQVEPKLTALQQSIGRHLGAEQSASGPAPGAKPGANPPAPPKK
ncbi:hypothetical protein (DUF2059) [Burkholderiales bacterium JOSHI_001]|nr:hypothetical protein (DUF2059) [Burkholderiales bacterium JOSHI_001]